MRNQLTTPTTSTRERFIQFATEKFEITQPQSVELATHRILRPETVESITHIGLDPSDKENWPNIEAYSRTITMFDRHSVVDSNTTRFYDTNGNRISVHSYNHANDKNPGSAVMRVESFDLASTLRREILTNAGRQANMAAHRKALAFYEEQKQTFNFDDQKLDKDELRRFGQTHIEAIYHAKAISKMQAKPSSNSVFDTEPLTEREARMALKKLQTEIDKIAGDNPVLKQELLFAVFGEVHGHPQSMDDPDMGDLPYLLQEEWRKESNIPLPVKFFTPEPDFKVIKDAGVQDGWLFANHMANWEVSDRLPTLDGYLAQHQKEVKFEKIIIFAAGSSGGIIDSNGLEVVIDHYRDVAGKDTVMAIGQDKDGSIHIYDCHKKEGGGFRWKKVGRLETRKLTGNLTDVKYVPSKNYGRASINKMHTYSDEYSPRNERVDLDGNIAVKTSKTKVVVYQRSDDHNFHHMSVCLTTHKSTDSDWPQTKF